MDLAPSSGGSLGGPPLTRSMRTAWPKGEAEAGVALDLAAGSGCSFDVVLPFWAGGELGCWVRVAVEAEEEEGALWASALASLSANLAMAAWMASVSAGLSAWCPPEAVEKALGGALAGWCKPAEVAAGLASRAVRRPRTYVGKVLMLGWVFSWVAVGMEAAWKAEGWQSGAMLAGEMRPAEVAGVGTLLLV